MIFSVCGLKNAPKHQYPHLTDNVVILDDHHCVTGGHATELNKEMSFFCLLIIGEGRKVGESTHI